MEEGGRGNDIQSDRQKDRQRDIEIRLLIEEREIILS